LLKNKPSRTVLVAVIDSGIDIDHEDLKEVMWVNTDEIPNNNIDDDKNGYIDDIHGWSFLGGKTGDVNAETLEVTREYVRLKKKYESITADKVGKKDKTEYELWLKVKKKFEAESQQANQQYSFYKQLYQNISFANDTLKLLLRADTLTYDLVAAADASNNRVKQAKETLNFVYTNAGKEASIEEVLAQIKDGIEYFEPQVQCSYNPDCASRAVVGDDPANVNEKFYGSNNVKGPDPFHGTHVAGIIAGNRKNTIGINGIADNVRIMSVRAVPNGDERDKDVANAIMYSVNNGAQIINMSFGKSLSPDKALVDKAVKYAETKGVLLIHAAGNDGKNNDEETSYPNRFYANGKAATNWIEIGASAWGNDDKFVANFSNYGKKSVNVFAPGVKIYSTTPNNEYGNAQGTSMASPATAGVAAILMAYFPHLSATQVKDVIIKSTRKFDGLKVTKPGSKDAVDFNTLSESGGLINAYEAVKLAMTIKPMVKKK
jgi:cell wall-associated protease